MTKLKSVLLDDKSAVETIETVAEFARDNNRNWALADGEKPPLKEGFIYS